MNLQHIRIVATTRHLANVVHSTAIAHSTYRNSLTFQKSADGCSNLRTGCVMPKNKNLPLHILEADREI
ncbi:MAG: hypothetical protein WBD58_06610 [Geitlerinemataceae cyanobacterium]